MTRIDGRYERRHPAKAISALLMAAGFGPPAGHALISLLALNGLRVSGGHRRRHRAPGPRARTPDPDHHPQGRQGRLHPACAAYRPGDRPGPSVNTPKGRCSSPGTARHLHSRRLPRRRRPVTHRLPGHRSDHVAAATRRNCRVKELTFGTPDRTESQSFPPGGNREARRIDMSGPAVLSGLGAISLVVLAAGIALAGLAFHSRRCVSVPRA
jgi:hypothetical protein